MFYFGGHRRHGIKVLGGPCHRPIIIPGSTWRAQVRVGSDEGAKREQNCRRSPKSTKDSLKYGEQIPQEFTIMPTGELYCFSACTTVYCPPTNTG